MKTSIVKSKLSVGIATALALTFIPPVETFAATPVLEEVLVTSRKREESLQEVPDAVTAFSAMEIENAGIDDVQDFIDMAPNIMMRETFRAGVTFITMRGVSTGQQGWPPITFVVDGVQSGSLDAINQGALVDIERIEVLRGPQGALYGAGAIAGAINVVTKRPTEESEHSIKLSYGKGNDFKVSGMSSGALGDNVLYRVNAYYNDNDGLKDSTDGVDMDFEEQVTLRGRLIFKLSESAELDLRAEYTDVEAGAAYQDKAPLEELDTFNSQFDDPRRGIVGVEDREMVNLSAKLDWELDFGNFSAVFGYSDIEQDLFASATWDKPPVISIFGFPVGNPGDTWADMFQDLTDDFETTTLDVRFTSDSDQALRWMLGASYLDREVYNFLGVGGWHSGDSRSNLVGDYLLARPDIRKAEMWGVYGQINYDLTDRLELTLAARYDENDYDTTLYADQSLSTPVPVLDPNGNPVDTLKANDDKFQPKVQLSYQVTDDVMVYATYAAGFRTGFFNTGNLTLPEETDNYEIGFKGTLADGRVRLNAAAFYIEYSDQQFTSIIADPPFRATSNIAETDIQGIEIELQAAITDNLELSAGLGLTDAEVQNDAKTDAPTTPEHTGNIAVTYTLPLDNGLELMTRADYRRQGVFYIDADNLHKVGAKDFFDARIVLRSDKWSVGIFGDNLSDERHAVSYSANLGGVRSSNKPRSYGIEAQLNF